MTKTLRHTTLCSALLLLPLFALAQGSVEDKINAAMKLEYRTQAELDRDADREPVKALSFMGLRDDMKVIEFFPAGQAWYTKILAPVLADKGELYVIDSSRTFDSWGNLLDNPVFKTTHKVLVEASYNREERRYNVGELNIPINDADLFLNIREYHNLNTADKARFNTAVYKALKSGGHYVIIDHTRRHMQPEAGALFRREDPVQVIVDVQAAGFVLEKTSDMFFEESDELNLEVGDKSVAGNTDRFFLVFKKP